MPQRTEVRVGYDDRYPLLRLSLSGRIRGGRGDGLFLIHPERTITATINGGGPELELRTLNGSIPPSIYTAVQCFAWGMGARLAIHGKAERVSDTKAFYENLASHYHLIFEDWDASMARQGKAF